MTTEEWKKSAKESDIQKQIIKWCNHWSIIYPELSMIFAIPSGGSRDIREANHLKFQGVKKGIPDLCLPVAKGKYHGLYLELKRIGGRLSKEQKMWIEALNKNEYKAEVAYGLDSAIEILKEYLES